MTKPTETLTPAIGGESICGCGLATAVSTSIGWELVFPKFLELNVKPTSELCAVRYRPTSPPSRTSARKRSPSARLKEIGPSAPSLVNTPNDSSRFEFRINGRSCQATPSVVGVTGLPVPSVQASRSEEHT